MLKEKEVIEISNEQYVIISSLKIKNTNYAYIININNYNDVLFIKNIKNEVEVINRKEKLNELIKQFNFKINEKELSML